MAVTLNCCSFKAITVKNWKLVELLAKTPKFLKIYLKTCFETRNEIDFSSIAKRLIASPRVKMYCYEMVHTSHSGQNPSG